MELLWHRWVTLSMLAMAFLAVTTAAQNEQAPAPPGLIPLTLNEFRRLFDGTALGRYCDQREHPEMVELAPKTPIRRPPESLSPQVRGTVIPNRKLSY